MKNSLRLSLITSALALPMLLQAVPAKRDAFLATQPDGSTITLHRFGDEFSHFLLTADDMVVMKNPATGLYNYACMKNGQLTPTDVKAVDPDNRTFLPADAIKISPDFIDVFRKKSPRRAIAQNGMGRFDCSFPRTGDVNVLIILVNYKDVKFTLSDPYEYFNNMLNQPGFSEYGGTGSCLDYFLENSNNQFRPHFDLYGPVDLPQNRSYYGANYGDFDRNPEQMVIHACELLDSEIDFTKYDNDGDGVVDNVYVFYAGQGEASYGSENTVWPHSYELSSSNQQVTHDGVVIDRYACSNEWEQSRPDGIGTFVHEFSHVMGLPDLYCTTYNYSIDYLTPGSYSALDYGPYNNDGRTPPAYSAYERNAMGWLEPIPLTDPASIELKEIGESNTAYIANTASDTEFFLFENRQKTGWDKYIPGHGMLIWHIDFNQSIFNNNSVNDQRHQYVDIVEANNSPDNSNATTMAGYPWPGTKNKTEFTPTSTPAFKDWNNNAINLPITNIAEADGVISFDVLGGNQLPPPIDTPVALEPQEVGDDYFVAYWQPIQGATDYELKLYQHGGGQPTEYTNDFGSGKNVTLPEDWSASAVAGYSSNGNYGVASPSFKLATDGAYLLSPLFDEDITAISFWAKGQQSNGSTLTLFGLLDDKWVTLYTYSPDKLEQFNGNITELPTGVRRIKFQWAKSQGNLSLDDIVITTQPGNLLMRQHTTDGATSFRVEGLAPGKYLYSVAATNGEYTTPHSAPVFATIGGSAINILNTLAPNTEYYDFLGRRLTHPAPGTICLRRQGSVTTRVIIR